MPLKKLIDRTHVYHVYYRRKGAYSLIKENAVKIIIGTVVIVGLIILLKKLDIFHPEQDAQYLKEHFNPIPVHLMLLLSEICIGLVPPPIFIFWAAKFESPYLMVFTLSLMSILGGVISFFIGRWLHSFPKIKKWVDEKYKKQFDTLKRFGGLLIVVSTVSPISFPTVAMIAGIVGFPFKTYFFLSLARFIKFYGWAFAIIEGLSLL
ncbi:MAG: VTT domain-containing protein [Schleiferiaceae bacterium]|jgi:membrane protein YqaA with SNARE-associated domain|nr:VTT domain-containing protein [Schleiferiaceae bacterium]